MYDRPYGPRGAEEESYDFWQDATVEQTAEQTADAAKRRLATGRALRSMTGLTLQDPYGPGLSPGVRSPMASKEDPLGSWTGTPADADTPTQDADDL